MWITSFVGVYSELSITPLLSDGWGHSIVSVVAPEALNFNDEQTALIRHETDIYKWHILLERGRRMQEEKQCKEDKQMLSTVWNGKYKFKLGVDGWVDEEGGRRKEEGGRRKEEGGGGRGEGEGEQRGAAEIKCQILSPLNLTEYFK